MAEISRAKVENGIVRLYRPNGEPERVICAGAVKAEVKGEEILVTMQGGKRKIYSIRGFFKKNA